MARLRTLKATRGFRLGAALYEPKFGHDIQSARSARETYDLALQRREEVLASMQRQRRRQTANAAACNQYVHLQGKRDSCIEQQILN